MTNSILSNNSSSKFNSILDSEAEEGLLKFKSDQVKKEHLDILEGME